MNNTDLVSIIMPSWNCSQFLKESIASVRSQTYSNWELLFQDDCSEDETYKIITSFEVIDSRIKYQRNNRNSGAAITRNNAIKRALGRWIAFLDSDDLWAPDKLEKQILFMEKNNYSFSYTKYCEIDEQSKEIGKLISGPIHIGKYGMYNFCWPGCLTVMYDANVVGLIQVADIKKNNDYALWLKVIKKTDCLLLDENLAKYRRRKGSISNHSYTSLLKWHYRLFYDAEGENPFFACMNTIRNLFFGVVKKLVYSRNYNPK